MNLLLVNYEYPPLGGGAANATMFIARALAELGHEPTVLTSAYDGLPRYSVDGGVRLYRAKVLRRAPDRSDPLEMGSFLCAALRRAPQIAKERRIEGAITFFTLPCGPVGWYLNRKQALPYIVSLRGGDVPGLVPALRRVHALLAPMRRKVLRRADAVVANSASLARLSENADPIPVRVIPNGVDTLLFRPATPDERGADDVFRILFVGRLVPQKDVAALLLAVAQSRRGASKRIALDIVGDGPDRAGLEKVARELDLTQCATWHGWLGKQEIAALYRRADCFVNPSRYEGMPNTVLEAMASGLPVVASNVGGNNELVTAGSSGFLFDLSEPDALGTQLAVLVNDQALAKAMGARGRQFVLARHSWKSVAERYVHLFSERREARS